MGFGIVLGDFENTVTYIIRSHFARIGVVSTSFCRISHDTPATFDVTNTSKVMPSPACLHCRIWKRYLSMFKSLFGTLGIQSHML